MIGEQSMARTGTGQWARRAAVLAVGLPLTHLPTGFVPASWECGPGYHKPLFGRCVPDPGIPLYQRSRYASGHGERRAHARLPTPIRSMAPWGPSVRG